MRHYLENTQQTHIQQKEKKKKERKEKENTQCKKKKKMGGLHTKMVEHLPRKH
jgi:hypothetical protein